MLRAAKRAKKSVKTKKARRRLDECEELLRERKEWLPVVDAHGVDVASDGRIYRILFFCC